MNVSFYIEHLYYLPQFQPVLDELSTKGHSVELLVNSNSINEDDAETIFKDISYNSIFVSSSKEIIDHFHKTSPDWIILGNNLIDFQELPKQCKTAMIYHGIGVKECYYKTGLLQTDVRFVEGEHRTREILRRDPQAKLAEVGFSKLDPLFQANAFDHAQLYQLYNLDQNKKTILYAPTFYPSSLELMAKNFPAQFSEYNIIIKPHEFSLTKSQYKNQRNLLTHWQQFDNVYLAQKKDFSLVPFMAIADILISEASSALFEFAALDKPVIWCDFLKLRWNYRGIFRYRLERRMDQTISRYKDIALHVDRYKHLKAVVDAELNQPDNLSNKRNQYSAELLGACDGRVSERIVQYLEQQLSLK